MVEHIKNSIRRADLLKSKLIPEIIELEGMCQGKLRHLLNNIVDIPGARYLEVGVYRGATFISALYKNDYDKAIAIDNWSEFGDYREDFTEKCNKYIGEYELINDDCFNVKLRDKINIYFYDGHHSTKAQSRALAHFYDSLEKEIIFIVDDYNWPPVRTGTDQAVKDWKILYETNLGDLHTTSDYSHGVYISVLKK